MTKAMHGTTVLAVRRDSRVAVGGDGQVTMGQTVVKHDAVKVRRLFDDQVLVGFSGAAADAFALLERFEAKLKEFQGAVPRAATELAKEWRTDRILRRLESLLVVADRENLLLVSGSGDVIAPDDGIVGVGSGGAYAVAAARALIRRTDLSARDIVAESLAIAADLCIYTNHNIRIEEL